MLTTVRGNCGATTSRHHENGWKRDVNILSSSRLRDRVTKQEQYSSIHGGKFYVAHKIYAFVTITLLIFYDSRMADEMPLFRANAISKEFQFEFARSLL